MNINEIAELRQRYEAMSNTELYQEQTRLNNLTVGQYDIGGQKEANDNVKILLAEVMEKKGMSVPNYQTNNPGGYSTNYNPPSNANASQTSGGPNMGTVIFGVVMLVAGIAITMASDGSIFYGLMIVGFITIVKGFIGD